MTGHLIVLALNSKKHVIIPMKDVKLLMECSLGNDRIIPQRIIRRVEL